MSSRRSARGSRRGSRPRSSRSADPLGDAARREAQGDLPGAIETLRRAAGSRHDGWPLRQSLGQLRARMGDPRGAVAEFERALVARPDAARTLNGLGAALAELGRLEAAKAALTRAIALEPDEVEARVALGALAGSEGQEDEALAHLRAALERDPEHPGARASLGRVQSRRGAHAEALAAFERACAAAPDDPMLATDAALARIAARDEAGAEAFVGEALRRHPGHAGLLSALALALGGLGRSAEVRRLQGLHRFVKTRRLDVEPAGLVPAILDDPTLTESPRRHATRGGLHSAAIDPERRPGLRPLREWIVQGVREYLGQLPQIVHPFVRARPRELGLQMWSVVLREGGTQLPHIHPEAWISGVFYVEIPAAVSGGAGGLCFGEVDPEIRHRARFERLVVRPEAGMLVLFPSYLWHRTQDWAGPGRRISVAFDVTVGP